MFVTPHQWLAVKMRGMFGLGQALLPTYLGSQSMNQ